MRKCERQSTRTAASFSNYDIACDHCSYMGTLRYSETGSKFLNIFFIFVAIRLKVHEHKKITKI